MIKTIRLKEFQKIQSLYRNFLIENYTNVLKTTFKRFSMNNFGKCFNLISQIIYRKQLLHKRPYICQ